MGSRRQAREYAAKVTYELSWADFERRERWRQIAEIWGTLGAAQKLRCKSEHPEAYKWLQANA